MNNPKNKRGFSLIELSIVIVIISILVAGALSVSVSGVTGAKVKVTRDRMNQLYQALGAYVVANSRLPCPASLISAKGAADYGVAGAAGNCNLTGVYQQDPLMMGALFYGMVPVNTLNLPADLAEDAFGNKIVYVVNRNYTSSETEGFPTYGNDPNAQSVPALAITVNDAKSPTPNSNVILVLMSYGPNGNGAYGINSTTPLQLPGTGDTDELENYVSSALNENNSIFVATSNSDVFDDIVLYKTKRQLVNDFKANSLLLCPEDTFDTGDLLPTILTTAAPFPDTTPVTKSDLANIILQKIPDGCYAAPWTGTLNTIRRYGPGFSDIVMQDFCYGFQKFGSDTVSWKAIQAGTDFSMSCTIQVTKKEKVDIPSGVCTDGTLALASPSMAGGGTIMSEVGPYELTKTYTLLRTCDQNGVWQKAIRTK